MQYPDKKNYYFISFHLLAILFSITVRADNVDLIKKADNFFMQKKFSESLKIYEQAFADSTLQPQMMLRMAFIREGLGDYAESLYYLNKYYLLQPDQKVLKKMDELAEKNRLKGYVLTDASVFWTFYDKYYLYLVTFFFAIGLVMFINLMRKVLINDFISIQRSVGVLFVLIIYLFLINIRPVSNHIIIKNDDTYLMEAPSAGSRVIQIINRGHRLDFNSTKDIWIETEWEGKKAYINHQNTWKVEN